MNHRGSELQVECGDTLCFSNHVDLDNPAVLENEVDDHARLTSWREHEAGVAVHQSKLRCSPAPSIGCVPPRRHRRQATSRPIQPAGALAQDQEQGLFAGGRSGRSVQPTAAVGTMKYTGPPATLGSSAKAQVRLIVWCRDCQHQVEHDPAEQVALYGADLPVRDWVKRLVCSQCGSRSIDFVLTGAGP